MHRHPGPAALGYLVGAADHRIIDGHHPLLPEVGHRVRHNRGPVPLVDQHPGHPKPRVKRPQAGDLVHQIAHSGGRAGIRQHRNDYRIAGQDCRNAGGRQVWRAVDDHHVVGVVLLDGLPHVSDRPIDPPPVSGGRLQVQRPQVLRGREHVQVWHVGVDRQLIVADHKSPEQSAQAGIFAGGEQDLGGVGLSVRVHQQHPQMAAGGQHIGQVDGGGGLAHPALSVDDCKCSHG